jgi:hypothetical protein
MECAHGIVERVCDNAEAADLSGGSERCATREQKERTPRAGDGRQKFRRWCFGCPEGRRWRNPAPPQVATRRRDKRLLGQRRERLRRNGTSPDAT